MQWLLRFGRDAPSQGLGVYGDIHSETMENSLCLKMETQQSQTKLVTMKTWKTFLMQNLFTWICNTIMSAVEMQVYLLYMTHTYIYIEIYTYLWYIIHIFLYHRYDISFID